MNRSAFYASRFQVGLGWFTVLGLLALAVIGLVRSGVPSWGPTAALLTLLAVYIAAGLLQRSRPLVEVSEEAVTWRLLIGFRRAKSVPFTEIVGTEARTPWALRLRTRSGGTSRMPLHQLSRSDRRAVRQAVESRIVQRA